MKSLASRIAASGLIVATCLVLPVTDGSAQTRPGLNGVAGPYLAAEQAARRGDIAEASRLFAKVLARDPGNVEVMERAISHQVAAGQIAQAVAISRKLNELSPNHHLGTLVVAAHELRTGKFAEAREMLDAAGGSGPFVSHILAAWAAYGEGDQDGAKAILGKLKDTSAGGPVGTILADYHLALMAAATGDLDAAQSAVDAASEASNRGGSNRIIQQRARIMAERGQFDEAKALVDERLSLTLGDRRLQDLRDSLERGEAPGLVTDEAGEGAAEALYAISGYIQRGNNRLLSLAYARLASYLDPQLIEAQLLIGDILAQDQQYGLAIEAYARIPADAPEAADAMIGRAEALRNAGEVEEGLSVLRELAASDAGGLEAYTALGDMLRQAMRYEEAAQAYDMAVAEIAQPENRHWVLFYQRGITFERSKEWEKAEADFRKALELEPDQPLVLNYLGYSFVEMGENLDEAQEMIEKAVERRPDDGYIVDSLGWVLYRLGRSEEALEHLERAVELRPVDPVINDHYGDVLWVNGRKVEAEFQWKRALSFEPEEENEARIKRKLNVGLDVVLDEEAAAGKPAIIGSANETGAQDDGG